MSGRVFIDGEMYVFDVPCQEILLKKELEESEKDE